MKFNVKEGGEGKKEKKRTKKDSDNADNKKKMDVKKENQMMMRGQGGGNRVNFAFIQLSGGKKKGKVFIKIIP